MADTVQLAVDGQIEPYTQGDIERLLRQIAKRLVEIIEAQRVNNTEWADAKRAFLERKHKAVIDSYRSDPDAPKWVHEAAAAADCAELEATAFAWERVVRSLNDEAHSLRQIQSSLQSLYRSTGEFVGTDRGGRQR